MYDRQETFNFAFFIESMGCSWKGVFSLCLLAEKGKKVFIKSVVYGRNTARQKFCAYLFEKVFNEKN